MDLIQQSTSTVNLMFLMLDSADHVSGKTGLSPTVTLSKNGGSFASPSGAVTEVGNGWYKVAGNTTDSNTLGPLKLHATASGADPNDTAFFVVAFNPLDSVRAGLTALPNAAAGANGGLPLGDANGRVDLGKLIGTALTETSAGYLAAAFKKLFDVATPVLTAASVNQTGDSYARLGANGAGLTALGDTRLGNLDAAVSSRLAPTTAGRTLDVSAGGEAGIDLANVGSPTTTLNLSGTTIGTATNLTNAATNGDLTGTMKTSVTAAVPTASANASAVWTYASASLGSTSTVGGWFNTLLQNLTDRLGPFIGTGDSNVWSYFLAIMRKDVSAPADVGGTFDPPTDSLEALQEQGAQAVTLADGAITAAKIADGAITAAKLADGAITNAKVADGVISAAKVADAAITAAKIADSALTSAKFSVSAITGPASGLLERLTQLWRRRYKKRRTRKTGTGPTTGVIEEYADDGSTVIATTTFSTDGTTATFNDAT